MNLINLSANILNRNIFLFTDEPLIYQQITAIRESFTSEQKYPIEPAFIIPICLVSVSE